MLSNAYFLAKFRFDTAENEPAKNLQNFQKMHFRKVHFRKMHFRKMHFRKMRLRQGTDGRRRATVGAGARAAATDARARGAVARRSPGAEDCRGYGVRREVNNSLIIVNFFHKIQNFRQISDLFS